MTISAEAVASGVTCGPEVVIVPERGHIDVVTKSLIVKVGALNTRWQRNFYLSTMTYFTDKVNTS